MSYVYGVGNSEALGWGVSDLTSGINTIGKAVVSAPTHLSQGYKTAQQMYTSSKNTLKNVAATAQNAKDGSDKLNNGMRQWNAAKPFVYVGGAVLLFFVMKKLV